MIMMYCVEYYVSILVGSGRRVVSRPKTPYRWNKKRAYNKIISYLCSSKAEQNNLTNSRVLCVKNGIRSQVKARL